MQKPERTFAFALKCPRCWGFALFADAVPERGAIVQPHHFYDLHGEAPTPTTDKRALCPLCGGYLAITTAELFVPTPSYIVAGLKASL